MADRWEEAQKYARVCGCGDWMYLPWEKDRCERCMSLDELPTSVEEYRQMRAALQEVPFALARAESSGREAERAELHPLLFTVQGHLIAWSTVEGVPPLPSALVAALRQIEALRARPGGTNGR